MIFIYHLVGALLPTQENSIPNPKFEFTFLKIKHWAVLIQNFIRWKVVLWKYNYAIRRRGGYQAPANEILIKSR